MRYKTKETNLVGTNGILYDYLKDDPTEGRQTSLSTKSHTKNQTFYHRDTYREYKHYAYTAGKLSTVHTYKAIPSYF